MEQKKLYQGGARRMSADPTLRERILNTNEDELISILKEHGISDISKEEAVKLCKGVQDTLDNEGVVLDDAELEKLAGGGLLAELTGNGRDDGTLC